MLITLCTDTCFTKKMLITLCTARLQDYHILLRFLKSSNLSQYAYYAAFLIVWQVFEAYESLFGTPGLKKKVLITLCTAWLQEYHIFKRRLFQQHCYSLQEPDAAFVSFMMRIICFTLGFETICCLVQPISIS